MRNLPISVVTLELVVVDLEVRAAVEVVKVRWTNRHCSCCGSGCCRSECSRAVNVKWIKQMVEVVDRGYSQRNYDSWAQTQVNGLLTFTNRLLVKFPVGWLQTYGQ